MRLSVMKNVKGKLESLRRPGTFLKKGSWTSKNFCFAWLFHPETFESFVPINNIYYSYLNNGFKVILLSVDISRLCKSVAK